MIEDEWLIWGWEDVGSILVLQVGGQAVLGRQSAYATPWLTERHGYDPTYWGKNDLFLKINSSSIHA